MSFAGSLGSLATLTGRDSNLADLGASFMAFTPTPGTGIIGHAAPTTFDETKPYLLVYNGGSNIVVPAYLTLHVTVVGTAGTRVQFTQAVDSGNRYSSGGTACTVTNTNMNSTATSGVQVYCGAVTASAATALRRVVAHQTYRAVIEVVEDTYSFNWGSPLVGLPTSLTTASTAINHSVFGYQPVEIGPGQSFLIHQWSASQTVGTTFQVQFGFFAK